jgi:hypothetical protein
MDEFEVTDRGVTGRQGIQRNIADRHSVFVEDRSGEALHKTVSQVPAHGDRDDRNDGGSKKKQAKLHE